MAIFPHLNWIILTHFALDICQDCIIGDVGCLRYVPPSLLGNEWDEESPIIFNVQKRKRCQVLGFAAARLEAYKFDIAGQTLSSLLSQVHYRVSDAKMQGQRRFHLGAYSRHNSYRVRTGNGRKSPRLEVGSNIWHHAAVAIMCIPMFPEE